MMRKTILHGTRHVVTTLLLAAAFLSLAQPSDAAPITRKQAEQRAAKFFHKRMVRRAAPVQLSLALEKPTDATSAGYYIYNKVGGGYAIVSADDTQAAIIGFSDSGHIDADEMPDAMRWWLDGFYRQAKTDEQTDYPAPIAPMLTSQWGQNAPYNLQTPLFSGAHAPAGCGAVALAQIIRYQQWPFSVDDIPSTNQCEKLPPTTFDFDKLLDTYDADSPADCQEEVAKLMRYVGQAISTTYGRNSSSVKPDGVDYGIFTYLKFQNSFIKKRNAYPNQGVWEDEMYESLRYGNPVFYGGEKTTGGGHAFVLDGYRDGYFHINWGWTGSYDGYFLLSDLSLNSTTKYNKNQYAFTNLQNPYNSDVDFRPSEIIHTSDMFFNPELSDEGCLIRENEEADFAGIVIQEDRFFDIGKVNATIQYGLALCEDVNVIEVLADTLLDLSDTDSRKQRLTFRFSIGHDIPCGGYSFQTVSRCSEDDAWQINNINAIDLYENSYIVDILEDRIYLDYVTSNFTNPSSSIKTGFLSDEKYLTIDEEGIVSQNLKMICNYSGNLPNHYYDYGICLEGDDTDYPVKPILLQKPLSMANGIPCVFDFDVSALPDGDYYLRGVECECGRYPDWGILGYPNDEKVKLVKQGNRIYVEPESLTTLTCNSLALRLKAEAAYDVVEYTRNASTGNFDVPIKYSVSNSQEGGYADSGVGLFYDGTLQHILYSNNCEYLTDNTITRDATVHIPANLPEGDYTIRGIGRDANTTEWQDISAEEAVVFATLKNDTLYTINYKLYNTKNLCVESIAYLNDHEVRVSMSNPSDYPMKGYVTVTFSAIDPSMVGEIIEPRDTCSYRMKVSLGKHESTSLVVPVSLTTEANDFVFYDCQFKVLNDTYSLSFNVINPLTNHIDFDNVSVDAVNDSTLFDQFRLYFTFNASPAAERTMVVARNVDETGNILAEYCYPHSGDKVTSACYLDFFSYPLYYPHYVNSKIHFELGYTKYYNDTVIVYRSHDYELAPFVSVDSYQDNVSRVSEQRRFFNGWTVPENVTYVSFEKASRVGEMVSVVPNHNPNTVYLFREDQPVPDCMQDRFVTTSEQIGSREFHIIDPYPVTTQINGSNIQYEQHFNPGEWLLLGTPFVRVTDLDALSQFDDVMVFDHIQDNTIYFKEWEQTANVREWPTLYLVRGSGKEVNFINGDYGISSKIADYLGPTWGNFKAMRRLIPCHYDVMYQLSPDGTHFYLTEGDVQPFRFVLLPTGSEMPERIKVVIEGYDPPTAITDVREQPQVKARYATDGRAVGSGYRGIVVEVDGNGKARKVVRQ